MVGSHSKWVKVKCHCVTRETCVSLCHTRDVRVTVSHARRACRCTIAYNDNSYNIDSQRRSARSLATVMTTEECLVPFLTEIMRENSQPDIAGTLYIIKMSLIFISNVTLW